MEAGCPAPLPGYQPTPNLNKIKIWSMNEGDFLI
jgi:hypothetical protein